MDGLLLNTEDIITESTNKVLAKHGRPPFTRSIRTQLMGIPDSTNSPVFHDWAKLPISHEQFAKESSQSMKDHFPNCEPLPGAENILSNLAHAHGVSGEKIQLGLASTTKTATFALKTSRGRTKKLLDHIELEKRVLGDDPRIKKGRGKPAPDIYILALEALNSGLEAGGKPITADECLVFEDSVVGVEAGRRAGMRVVWIPHSDVAVEYEGRYSEILAGRMGIVDIGDEGQLGKEGDGWGEMIKSLEDFNYEKYGIRLG